MLGSISPRDSLVRTYQDGKQRGGCQSHAQYPLKKHTSDDKFCHARLVLDKGKDWWNLEAVQIYKKFTGVDHAKDYSIIRAFAARSLKRHLEGKVNVEVTKESRLLRL